MRIKLKRAWFAPTREVRTERGVRTMGGHRIREGVHDLDDWLYFHLPTSAEVLVAPLGLPTGKPLTEKEAEEYRAAHAQPSLALDEDGDETGEDGDETGEDGDETGEDTMNEQVGGVADAEREAEVLGAAQDDLDETEAKRRAFAAEMAASAGKGGGRKSRR